MCSVGLGVRRLSFDSDANNESNKTKVVQVGVPALNQLGSSMHSPADATSSLQGNT